MKNILNRNAREALAKMKLEIADELDADITNGEKLDGTMVENLVNRAEKKINKLEYGSQK